MEFLIIAYCFILQWLLLSQTDFWPRETTLQNDNDSPVYTLQ